MIHLNKIAGAGSPPSETRWLIESDATMQALVLTGRELDALAYKLAFRLGSATFVGRGSSGLVARFERGDGRSAELHLCYSDELPELLVSIRNEFE